MYVRTRIEGKGGDDLMLAPLNPYGIQDAIIRDRSACQVTYVQSRAARASPSSSSSSTAATSITLFRALRRAERERESSTCARH